MTGYARRGAAGLQPIAGIPLTKSEREICGFGPGKGFRILVPGGDSFPHVLLECCDIGGYFRD